MKTIKILSAIVLITTLSVLVWIWSDNIKPPPPLPEAENQFTKRIKIEIDSLKKSPAKVFCQKFYNDIQYRINDYHKQKFLHADENDNNQRKEQLSKELYSAYVEKFIESAIYVFNGSEWKPDDIKFIGNEVKTLKKSLPLGPSPIISEFRMIEDILKKYYEIAGFISNCNKFSYSDYDIYYSSFPDVSDSIKKTRDYLNNNLDNNFVKNCTRLKNDLEAIPQNLFNKHINYLRTKIEQNGNKYENYDYQSDYDYIIYQPLKRQLNSLDNNIYGIDDNIFDEGYNSLDKLLSSYNRQATDYFRRKNSRY